MPIFATPKFKAATPAASCDDQATLTPATTRVFGCEVPGRRKAVQTVQGQAPTIAWQITDTEGRPVDLSGCGAFETGDPDTGEVVLTIREAMQISGCPGTTYTITGTVDDPETGIVNFALSADVTERAGIYLCEAAVYNTDGTMVFTNQLYLIVNRGLTAGDRDQITGLPSIAEIRLHMRDSDPGDNPLLESVQFDLAEVIFAIERPVLYWNESQPPINNTYNTSTFPWRYYWLEGIVAQLYIMAAHWFRRNRAAMQSQGGLGIDDLNKAKEYEEIGQQKWAEFKDWVLRKKVQFNAESAIQWTGSAYGSRW